MTDTKSANFHRLAAQRVEKIQDAIRVLSNLSGPSYEWTADEVLSYLDQVSAAVAEAQARFADTKCWRTNPPLRSRGEMEAVPVVETTPEPAPEPEAISDMAVMPPILSRRLTIGEIITEANDDREMLAETVALQRIVIDDFRAQLERR